MSQRHWLKVKKGDTPVYSRQILGNNIFADEEFYKNLNLDIDWDDGRLEETEVQLEKFMLEWWKYIVRTFDLESIGKDYKMLFKWDKDDDNLYSQLVFQNMGVLNQYFSVLESLMAYTDTFSVEKLKEGYKLYISIYWFEASIVRLFQYS